MIDEADAPKAISSELSIDQLQAFTEKYYSETNVTSQSYFVFITSPEPQLISLKDYLNSGKAIDEHGIYFCFNDPSSFDNPGWPLRTFILFLVTSQPQYRGKWINVTSVRQQKGRNLSQSLIIRVKLPESVPEPHEIKWVGWEKNQQGNLAPRFVSLEKTMDPLQVAKASINLNLKLMKWRLLPALDLDKIQNVKCLLVGAGTLGCGIARGLLAWGISNITFVDSGVVRFSNPVRQCLYTYEDAKSGTKRKVEAAVERLKEINPNVEAAGFDLHIPMPDHPVGVALREKTEQELESFKQLIQNHDVVFLLTDSRESRWLPTMLGAYHKKVSYYRRKKEFR